MTSTEPKTATFETTLTASGNNTGIVVPRAVEMPADFAAALDAEEAARRFFDGLSNSLQRYHVDNINAAKTPDTRQRRIDKAIGLFLEGKRR